MCGIYGVLSYKDKLKDINHLVDLLGEEIAERGTDATGVAYVNSGIIKIHKQAISAYKFNPNIPKTAKSVIGHTRHSTQGDKSKNYNNHPWRENVRNCQFALAHNGIISNDDRLQDKYDFKSKIHTDSFVAVQLLKKQNKLDFDSIKFMAEEIEGSYSFNILDNYNNIYLVKVDSPISIVHFKEHEVYVFASTDRILWRAIINSELFSELRNGTFEEIILSEGDILRINSNGTTEIAKFNYRESLGMRWYDYIPQYTGTYRDEYLDDIKTVAAMYGEEPEMIQELYEMGYPLDEIEEMIYCGMEI